jgi:2-haloalkanoic acid dehalogenase type II
VDVNDFDGFTALSFDCYGTLIDWETGIVQALRRWADRAGVARRNEKLLHWFSAVETAVQGEHSPALLYPDVLAETLRRIGERADAPVTNADAAEFGASVGEWPAFPDSPEALRRLKTRFKLIILSNIDRSSFAVSNRRLSVEFDLIITAEDVGAYKPSAPHFDSLLESLPALGIERHELLHVAQSLYHDHEPARRFDIPSVWIDRRHEKPGYGATPAPSDEGITPTWRYSSMAEFAAVAVPEPEPGGALMRGDQDSDLRTR